MVIFMMLQATEEENKIFEKLHNAKNESEKEKIRQELREYLKKRREELKECPFAH